MVRERVGVLIIATDTVLLQRDGSPWVACRASCHSRNRSPARLSGSGRADELFNQHSQYVSAARRLHCKSTQGRKWWSSALDRAPRCCAFPRGSTTILADFDLRFLAALRRRFGQIIASPSNPHQITSRSSSGPTQGGRPAGKGGL